MKRLFQEDERYSSEGDQFDARIEAAIRPIVEEYATEGYSTRDLQLILLNAAIGVGLDAVIGGRYAKV